MSKRVIYQLFPRLYGNLNDNLVKGGTLTQNGCGKFSDITSERLQYLKSTLKVTDIWYTGVINHATKTAFAGMESSSPQVVKGEAGSPYAIRDYYDVAPYLADNIDNRMHELEDLFKRTHDAGLKVIIDFVPNHVAREYLSDLGKDDDTGIAWNASNDFFYFPGQPLRLPGEIPDADAYNEFPAKATGNDCFTPCPSINDWYETVKLNYCDFHTPTWDKMAAILDFWASKGADGFRCDMVELVPAEFFKWAIARTKQAHPGTFFIAEVYIKELYSKYINDIGFDYLYDKSGLYDSLRAIMTSGGDARTITGCWQSLGSLQEHMLNFLENHDEQRIASDFFCGNPAKAMCGMYVSLLLNNAPFMIYNAQEYGERGMDCEGFSGTDGRTTIFDYWSMASMRRAHKGCLEASEEDTHRRYLELFGALGHSRALSEGRTFDLCYAQTPGRHFDPRIHFAFIRHVPGEAKLVVANFSPIPSEIHLQLPQHAFEWMGQEPGERLNPQTQIKIHVNAWDGSIMDLNF